LKTELKVRFPVDFWTDAHLIAAQLDPRVRFINSLGWTAAESQVIRDRGVAALAAKYTEMLAQIQREAPALAPPLPPAPAVNGLAHVITRVGEVDITMTPAELRALNEFYEALGAPAPEVPDETELDRYRRLRPDRNADPMAIWTEIEGDFPTLARLARIYLAIPASNASVERLFSAAGNVYSLKRGSLAVDMAVAIIFLYSNRNVFWPKGNVGAIDGDIDDRPD